MSKPSQLDRAIANLDDKIAAAGKAYTIEIEALKLARQHLVEQQKKQKPRVAKPMLMETA